MKKILWLCPLMLLMMAFIGCDDKEKDDDESLGGQLSETTWAAEVKKYPFLTNFPEYDGELENHRYDDTYGILQYIIMDYKLAAIISYGGGTLALSLSAEPIQ